MKMIHDDFEAWVRESARGCMEPDEIDALCQGALDFDGKEYHFIDSTVQAQWLAWQAALANDDKAIESIIDGCSK